MFTLPNALPMAFKGGTSLSKVFGAINRFSEDIDITVDYRMLAERLDDDFDPFSPRSTNNQVRKFSDRLKDGLKLYAETEIVPHIEAQIELLPFADQLTVEYSEDGEKIWVHFPSVTEEQDDYLKSSILIELGGRNVIDPNAIHEVKADIAQAINNPELIFPTANATVLAPERTFWEKATLIHSECNRGNMKASAHRLSRHWYDLYQLNDLDIDPSAIEDKELLKDVVKHKKCFYRAGYSNYDACLEKSFKLIPNKTVIAELEKDYRNMIYDDAPTFDDIITWLSELESTFNK